MPPVQEAVTDLPVALFLFGFANRVFSGGPTIKYGIEIAPLFLLRQGVWGDYLPPSLHYASCFPVSASQVFPPSLHLRASVIQAHKNKHDKLPTEQKLEKKQMLQAGKPEYIPSSLMTGTYSQLLPAFFVCIYYSPVFCSTDAKLLPHFKFTPSLTLFDVLLLFLLLFCTRLMQLLVGPVINNSVSQ